MKPSSLKQIKSTFNKLPTSVLLEAEAIIREHDASRIIELIHNELVDIHFDWQSWEEGSQFANQPDWDFTDKDEIFCLKLFWALIRNDKFTSGALDAHLKSGLLKKLVDRLIELKPAKNIKTYQSSDFDNILNDYSYQPELTAKLDMVNSDFNDNHINEIALWKVNRYYKLPNNLLSQLNQLQGFAPGEHRNAIEVLNGLLDINGVDIAMASTILRFRNPEVFQIIDKRAYRVVYGEALKLYHTTAKAKKVNTYFDYLDKLIDIAKRRSVSFTQLDRILYQLDINLNSTIKI